MGRVVSTLSEALELIRSKTLEAEDVIEKCYGEISRLNETLRAFITVSEKPKKLDHPTEPLMGVPISLKDLFYTRDLPTTAGSRILAGFRPGFDADVVSRLRELGAFLIGKTNMHEFAFGVTNRNPHYGDCRNPWDRSRVSGGSSGGSAVSVATGMCLASLGTDTAGSVRIPASLCGVVGYKPTYDTLSRRGVIPLSWTLDHVGFLARCVRDASLLMRMLSTNPRIAEELSKPLEKSSIKGIKIGIPRNYFLEHLQEDVERNFWNTVHKLEGEGAEIKEITVDEVEAMVKVRYVIVHAEAAAYHRRFMKDRFDDYGEELRRRLAEGALIPASTYINAQRLRKRLVNSFRRIFKHIDFLLTPTTPITAPRVEDKLVEVGDVVMDVRPALLRLTEPFNVAGVPALSIPMGFSGEGLPTGLQIVADVYGDAKLLSFALAVEELLSS